MHSVRLATLLLGLILSWQPAAAAIVTYDFTATVTSQNNLGLSFGDPVTGSFSYDTAASDSDADANRGVYFFTQTLQFAVGSISATVPFGLLQVVNGGGGALDSDRLTGGTVGAANPWTVSLFLFDFDQTVFSSDDLPSPLPALDPFETRELDFALIEQGVVLGSFTTRITSLTLRPVPEPSALLMVGGMALAGGLLLSLLASGRRYALRHASRPAA
jgi:hypothetical protein